MRRFVIQPIMKFAWLASLHSGPGFFWRALMTDTGVEPEAWNYLAVCVPIVVFFAPFGSIVSSHFHRQVLAALIYVIDTVALVTAFAVIPMTLERRACYMHISKFNAEAILKSTSKKLIQDYQIFQTNRTPSCNRGLMSGGLIIGGFLCFYLINKGGERVLKSVEQAETRAKEIAGSA